MSSIWTPATTERQTVNLPPEYMKMLAVLAETSAQIDLGLHCSRCNQDLSGKNATADKGWIMECACRTFVGRNPTKAN
jgi:hypothetical protein